MDIASVRCPICGGVGVTTRVLPIELYKTGQPRYRVSGAIWCTCPRCGASWYPEGTLDHSPTEAIPDPEKPSQDV